MDYVHKPAVFLGEEGQAVLRRADDVHKVYVGVAVVQNAVYVEGEEHQNEQEFQTVEIIFDCEFHFLAGIQVQGEHDEDSVIAKILQGNQPAAVSRRRRRNQNRRNAAKQTAGAHEGEEETVQFLVFRQIQNANKDDLYRAKVEG